MNKESILVHYAIVEYSLVYISMMINDYQQKIGLLMYFHRVKD